MRVSRENQNILTFVADAGTEPPLRRAMIASSSLNYDTQGSTITNLHWLPTWCHISPDGKIHKTTSSTLIRAQFASSSLDGPISFWSLPRSLSTPASHRSPLQLTLAPTYKLSLPQEFPPITSFCLPIGRSEDTSRLNLREDNKDDLARLQQLFVGTSTGKVCRCTWSGLQLEDDGVTDESEVEVCEVEESCPAHDGWVRSMVKSPHLDDVMLTVGGSVFALWKEDFARAPIFSRRSGLLYGDGCWSNGRPGLIVLARMDGGFEMWDLKRRSNEPVITQTVSREVTPYVYPSSTRSSEKFLAVLDGASTLRIFREATESRDDEDLERLEWFEEFAWRETKRKLDFHRWQDKYLREHPVALQRQQERRQAEADRRRREAREKFLKEQEIEARKEAERELRQRRVSKTVIWRQNELKRAEGIILAKKGLVPHELEEKRRPIVLEQEKRRARMQKVQDELAKADDILNDCLALEVPELRHIRNRDNKAEVKLKDSGTMFKRTKEICGIEYQKVREELIERLKQKSGEPKFDWSKVAKAENARVTLL